jgi:hypothetical protein
VERKSKYLNHDISILGRDLNSVLLEVNDMKGEVIRLTDDNGEEAAVYLEELTSTHLVVDLLRKTTYNLNAYDSGLD